MRNKCLDSTSGRKSVTENGFSNIDFLHDRENLSRPTMLVVYSDNWFNAHAQFRNVIFEFSAPIFTRT